MSRFARSFTAALLAATPAALHAQYPSSVGARTRSIGSVGITGVVAVPQNEFHDYVKAGYGLGVNFVPTFGKSGAFGLRIEGGYLNYGNATKRACLSTTIGCRITVDVNTTNNIIVGGIGPQIMVPTGPIRPYLTGTVGFAYFFTESSINGTNNSNDSPFASTRNASDGTFAWTGGGGVLFPLRQGARQVSIDVGARYHGNGEAEYLREKSITDNPDGTVTITPIHSRTDFLGIYAGVSVGL